MQINFYRKIKTLNKKWDASLKSFLDVFASEKVLIILFGSRSREDYNLLSDYDIVIISEKVIEKPVLDFPSDLFVFTFNEASNLLTKDNFIIKNALLNGEILLDNLNNSNELFKQVIE